MRFKGISVKIFPFEEYGYGINFWDISKDKAESQLKNLI